MTDRRYPEYVGNQVHEKHCKGRIIAMKDQSTRSGVFNECDPIECERCGMIGEIRVDDEGVYPEWHRLKKPGEQI